jgi:4-amino-4-deoxy-L-arabinose transferase-like glycosyltransferase
MSISAPATAPVMRGPARFRASVRVAPLLRSPLWPSLGVAILAGALRLSSLDGTRTNPYYDAAVRTMSLSVHNFLYGVFTPGGQLAIDKPPVDLWFQVASVKLFGFSPEALILPQAIGAALACALLCDLLRRVFGLVAGLAGGLALAVLPISVVTSRSDTMDSLMMALTVLAAWLVLHAARTGRARWLYLAAVVMGLDFEVKLFEALVALPGLALLYWLGSSELRRRRAEHVGLATVVFVAVALSWPVFVSLTPASSRPFPIGSTNGSVWNSIFVFNGTDRISPPKPQPLKPLHVHRHSRHHALAPLHRFHRQVTHGAQPGPRRFLENPGGDYGVRIGLELVAALAFGGLAAGAAAAYALRRRPPPAGARLKLALGWATAVWLLPGLILWSSVNVLHARYLESITPALAAALGIGLASLARLASRQVAGIVCLAAALGVSSAFALHRASLGGVSGLIVVAAALAIAVSALACGLGRMRPALAALAAALAVTAVLAAPLHTSLALVRSHASDSGFPGALSPHTADLLGRYLVAHQGHARYELAASSWDSAGELIARDARPVLVLTSVNRRPVVRVRKLRSLATAGEVRYVMITGHCGTTPPSHLPRCPATVAWARRHGVDVTRATGLRQHGLLWRLAVRRRSSTPSHSRTRATRAGHRRAAGGSRASRRRRARRRSASR